MSPYNEGKQRLWVLDPITFSFSRFDASFLLKFEDVSEAKAE